MDKWKRYVRTGYAEMRPVTDDDIWARKLDTELRSEDGVVISISDEDINNGSPKKGDMIARNPINHKDKWLVAEDYFKENFKPWDPKRD